MQMYGDYTILLWCKDNFYKKLVKFFLSLYKARKTWSEGEEVFAKYCGVVRSALWVVHHSSIERLSLQDQSFYRIARVGTQSSTISQIAMKMDIVDGEKDPLTYIAP